MLKMSLAIFSDVVSRSDRNEDLYGCMTIIYGALTFFRVTVSEPSASQKS